MMGVVFPLTFAILGFGLASYSCQAFYRNWIIVDCIVTILSCTEIFADKKFIRNRLFTVTDAAIITLWENEKTQLPNKISVEDLEDDDDEPKASVRSDNDYGENLLQIIKREQDAGEEMTPLEL